jgi:hypothetical protein
MDGNYLGWSQHIAPVIIGVPDRAVLELVGLAALIVSDDLLTALASLRRWPTTQAVPDGP